MGLDSIGYAYSSTLIVLTLVQNANLWQCMRVSSILCNCIRLHQDNQSCVHWQALKHSYLPSIQGQHHRPFSILLQDTIGVLLWRPSLLYWASSRSRLQHLQSEGRHSEFHCFEGLSNQPQSDIRNELSASSCVLMAIDMNWHYMIWLLWSIVSSCYKPFPWAE